MNTGASRELYLSIFEEFFTPISGVDELTSNYSTVRSKRDTVYVNIPFVNFSFSSCVMVRISIGFVPFCWLRAVEFVAVCVVTVMSASFTSTTILGQDFEKAISRG